MAELRADELLSEDGEETQDATLSLECEDFEGAELILSFDKKRYRVDAAEMLECLTRLTVVKLPTDEHE